MTWLLGDCQDFWQLLHCLEMLAPYVKAVNGKYFLAWQFEIIKFDS